MTDMDTTSWLLLAGVVVIAGKWSQGKGMDVPAVIALTLIAAMIAIMAQVQPKIANLMTVLVVVVVTLTYGSSILKTVRSVK